MEYSRIFSIGLVLTVVCLVLAHAAPNATPNQATSNKSSSSTRIVNVDVGDHCSLGAAPVGPNGSWQVVEKDVEKVCAPGTSCRKGACNCDDLPDGTVTGISVDSSGKRVCRRIAGQSCSSDSDCFSEVQCVKGVCTCDKTKKDFYCVDFKNDAIILA